MKNNIRIFTISVMFISLFCINAVGVNAEDDFRGHRPPGREGHFERMKKDLNLSDEQVAQIENDRKEGRSAFREHREKLEAKKQAMGEELQKDEFDMKEVNRIHSEIKGLLMEQEDMRLERILRMREILTPEQRRIMHEKIVEKRNKKINSRRKKQ